MNTRAIELHSEKSNRIEIKIYPGHFSTSHSHVNYYVDMTELKSYSKKAQRSAEELAKYYSSTPIDCIICLEGTRIVGAYTAEALMHAGVASINRDADIAIVTPEINMNNQMMFRDNLQPLLWNKRVLLMVASVTTGKTIARASKCIQYYNGQLAGICALFSAVDEVEGMPIHSLFTLKDIPDYRNYSPHECEYSKENKKIDAMVNSYGYTKF